MNALFKYALTGLAAVSLSASLIGSAQAETAKKKPCGPKYTKEFKKSLKKASFMPSLMKRVKQNAKELEITDEQMKQIDAYHKQHSPIVHRLVKTIMDSEAKAHQMSLDNFPPQQVAQVGSQSIQARHDLMMTQLKCRSFFKVTLSPEQYKKALTGYK